MIWAVAVAAGLGASWVLDVLKPFVAIPTRYKPFILLGLVGILGSASFAALQDDVARWTIPLLSISLASAKVLHAVTSRLQVSKDKARMEVLANSRRRS